MAVRAAQHAATHALRSISPLFLHSSQHGPNLCPCGRFRGPAPVGNSPGHGPLLVLLIPGHLFLRAPVRHAQVVADAPALGFRQLLPVSAVLQERRVLPFGVEAVLHDDRR